MDQAIQLSLVLPTKAQSQRARDKGRAARQGDCHGTDGQHRPRPGTESSSVQALGPYNVADEQHQADGDGYRAQPQCAHRSRQGPEEPQKCEHDRAEPKHDGYRRTSVPPLFQAREAERTEHSQPDARTGNSERGRRVSARSERGSSRARTGPPSSRRATRTRAAGTAIVGPSGPHTAQPDICPRLPGSLAAPRLSMSPPTASSTAGHRPRLREVTAGHDPHRHYVRRAPLVQLPNRSSRRSRTSPLTESEAASVKSAWAAASASSRAR